MRRVESVSNVKKANFLNIEFGGSSNGRTEAFEAFNRGPTPCPPAKIMQSKSLEILGGVVHKIPADLRKVFTYSKTARLAWENITPLARNEWICWIESARKPETRRHRIERTQTELVEGKRRPCCWAGCSHR